MRGPLKVVRFPGSIRGPSMARKRFPWASVPASAPLPAASEKIGMPSGQIGGAIRRGVQIGGGGHAPICSMSPANAPGPPFQRLGERVRQRTDLQARSGKELPQQKTFYSHISAPSRGF